MNQPNTILCIGGCPRSTDVQIVGSIIGGLGDASARLLTNLINNYQSSWMRMTFSVCTLKYGPFAEGIGARESARQNLLEILELDNLHF